MTTLSYSPRNSNRSSSNINRGWVTKSKATIPIAAKKLKLTSLCIDEEDIEGVRCHHRYLLPLLTSWTTKNPSRRYWVCPHYDQANSCDFWRWKDGEIDERSKRVIPKLIDKMTEMGLTLEEFRKNDKQKYVKKVEDYTNLGRMNSIEETLDYLKARIQKIEEKEKKSKFREKVLWLIILFGCIVAIRFANQLMNTKIVAMKLP